MSVPSDPGDKSNRKSVNGAKRTRKEKKQETGAQQDTTHSEQLATQTSEQATSTPSPQTDWGIEAGREGDVASIAADTSGTLESGLELLAHAKPGETRRQCWERLRVQARAAGMRRGQGPGTAYEWATQQVELLFPSVEPEPEPEESAQEAEAEPIQPDAPVITAAPDHVPGLGELPSNWGELPANASLQAEISWVSANRLRVRDGNGVDLSRALSPAPSYSALSWLETSILFPSKFADISVKATAQAQDETELVRRERLSIDEIRRILAEMLEAKD